MQLARFFVCQFSVWSDKRLADRKILSFLSLLFVAGCASKKNEQAAPEPSFATQLQSVQAGQSDEIRLEHTAIALQNSSNWMAIRSCELWWWMRALCVTTTSDT